MIEEGIALKNIEKYAEQMSVPWLPGKRTILRWRHRYPDFESMYALTGEGRADYHRTQAIESVESIMKREDAPQKVAVANVHLRILQIEQSKRKNSASRSSHFDNQTVEKDDDGDTIVEDHIERYNLILRAISHGRTNDEAVAELAPDLHKKRMDRSSDGSSNTKDT